MPPAVCFLLCRVGRRSRRSQIEPITDEVVEARELVLEMIKDFPFADQSSLANALGLALTPIVRRTISGTVPMALINAPQPGTGRPYLPKS